MFLQFSFQVQSLRYTTDVNKHIDDLNDNVTEQLNEIKRQCIKIDKKNTETAQITSPMVEPSSPLPNQDSVVSEHLLEATESPHLPKKFYNKLYFHSQPVKPPEMVCNGSNCGPNYRKMVAEALGTKPKDPAPDYDDDDEDIAGRKLSAISIESSTDLQDVMERDMGESWYRDDRFIIVKRKPKNQEETERWWKQRGAFKGALI